MDIKLSKEKAAILDTILTCMRIAVKNSSLFPPGHPSFDSSMKSFKSAIDKWLISEERFTIGVSSDNILLNGEFVKEGSDLYGEIASYLHPRGIIAISFLRNIDIDEISQFFAFLKNDVEVLSRRGGVAKNIPASPHLIIKEIDYSSILTSAKSDSGLDEKGMWRALTGIDQGLKGGSLPESKVEFIKDFLKDPKASAHVINKIYRQAIAGLNERSSADEIKGVLARINRYFEAHPKDGLEDAKKGIAGIISKLDPMLVAGLFKESGNSEDTGELSEELFRGMGDEGIADFIVSLIQSENTVNENFIKLFNKLSSKKEAPSAVAGLVADKMFDKGLINPGMLLALQLSIKDLFEDHPENDFISQIYKMTVSALVDDGVSAGERSSTYSQMAKEYEAFIQDENLKCERIRLLLNILWYENDLSGFQKICAMIKDCLYEIIDIKHTRYLREMFELFTEKLRPEQLNDSAIGSEVKKILDEIGDAKVIDRLISFIPNAEHDAIKNIGFILSKAEDRAIEPLLDLFFAPEGVECKEKIAQLLFSLGEKARSAFTGRVGNIVAGKPVSIMVQEMKDILKMMDAQSACALSSETIDKLFNKLDKTFGGRAHMRDLIKLCGDFKIPASIPHLGKMVAKRHFFNTKAVDRIRLEAVISLGRIGTPEALEYVKKASGDRSRSVRAMCSVVLRSFQKGL